MFFEYAEKWDVISIVPVPSVNSTAAPVHSIWICKAYGEDFSAEKSLKKINIITWNRI